MTLLNQNLAQCKVCEYVLEAVIVFHLLDLSAPKAESAAAAASGRLRAGKWKMAKTRNESDFAPIRDQVHVWHIEDTCKEWAMEMTPAWPCQYGSD